MFLDECVDQLLGQHHDDLCALTVPFLLDAAKKGPQLNVSAGPLEHIATF